MERHNTCARSHAANLHTDGRSALRSLPGGFSQYGLQPASILNPKSNCTCTSHLEAPGEGVALRVEQQQGREPLQGRRRGVQTLHRDASVVGRRLGSLQPALLWAVLHTEKVMRKKTGCACCMQIRQAACKWTAFKQFMHHHQQQYIDLVYASDCECEAGNQ